MKTYLVIDVNDIYVKLRDINFTNFREFEYRRKSFITDVDLSEFKIGNFYNISHGADFKIAEYVLISDSQIIREYCDLISRLSHKFKIDPISHLKNEAKRLKLIKKDNFFKNTDAVFMWLLKKNLEEV